MILKVVVPQNTGQQRAVAHLSFAIAAAWNEKERD